MKRNLIVVLVLIISILFCGCIDDSETFVKEGIVYKIDYGNVVGFTYTDWEDDLHFLDGDVFWIRSDNTHLVRLNVTGVYTFEKLSYEGEIFYMLRSVVYEDEGLI